MAVACYRNPLDRDERFVQVDGPAPTRMSFAGETRLWDLVDIQARGDEVPTYRAMPPAGSADLSEKDLSEFTWRLGELGNVILTNEDVREIVDRIRDQELAMGLMYGVPIEVPA